VKTILVILILALLTSAQSKPQKRATESPELTALRNEFIQATKEYKVSLEKLLASYQKSVATAQGELEYTRSLYASGLISIKSVEAGERAVAAEQDKVKEVQRRMASADDQIAETLAHADEIAQEYRKAVTKRASTRQRPCPSWTLTAYRRETKRSMTVGYKFVCLGRQ
jgi:hypothetical protein